MAIFSNELFESDNAQLNIDRSGTNPVIDNVRICGNISKNKRRYPPSCFGDGSIYENSRVNCDHAQNGPIVEKLIGWIDNCRMVGGVPRGRLNLLPNHPMTDRILWLAEHKPDMITLSHMANCDTAIGEDGWLDVIKINEVKSVDIVVGGATNASLFEQEIKMQKIKLSEAIARILQKSKSKKFRFLKEADEEMPDVAIDDKTDQLSDDMDDEETADAVGKALVEGMRELIDKFEAGDIDTEELKQGIMKLTDSYDDVNGDTKSEQHKNRMSFLEVENLGYKVGVKLTTEQINAAVLLPKSQREKYIRQFLVAEPPKSVRQNFEEKNQSDNKKTFAQRVRGE